MSNIGAQIEARRADVARVVDASGGIFSCRFFIDLTKPGEAVIPINFPVRFVEKPSVSTGWDMWRNQHLIPGRYPAVHCGVHVWNSSTRTDVGMELFDGCTLAVSVEGPPELALTLHVSFEGKALRNPA